MVLLAGFTMCFCLFKKIGRETISDDDGGSADGHDRFGDDENDHFDFL